MTETTPVPDQPVVSRRTFNARFNAGLTIVLAKLRVEEVPHIRRIVITVLGGTILVIGTALVARPVPGSGPVVILGGLAILGTEYAWARRWMRKGKLMARKALSRTQKILSFKEKIVVEAELRSKEVAAVPAEQQGEIEAVGEKRPQVP